MATINFYLDKEDKKGCSPIHLRVNGDGIQVKVATGEKVKSEYFDKDTQRVTKLDKSHAQINYHLDFLFKQTDELVNDSVHKKHSIAQLKKKITALVKAYKEGNKVQLIKEQVPLYGKQFTFVDLFAGAGGFSEGFLQAEVDNKYFDFVVGNDINENCELTHVVRYNHQLGLDAEFLCQDITEPTFLSNLMEKINGKSIDVVCGGPPCQSFSLAGKRKKFDKKDDLFSNYLEVIKILRPKYFIMENVKGILTKEKGKIKELILNEINSIVDIKELPKLVRFVKSLKKLGQINDFVCDSIIKKIGFEGETSDGLNNLRTSYIKSVESRFRKLIPEIADYKKSKTDIHISTIRHGFNMLERSAKWAELRASIIKEKDQCNIDNDYFVDGFVSFIDSLDERQIINKIEKAFGSLAVPESHMLVVSEILDSLSVYVGSFDDLMKSLANKVTVKQRLDLEELVSGLRLYKIEAPFVANSSNYGVPQNRERVLFIGCRKDQIFIDDVPATVKAEDKVSVFEALYDLDFIGNNQHLRDYSIVNIDKQFNGTAKEMKQLVSSRSVDGTKATSGKSYAEWSKGGRLNKFYEPRLTSPFYVRSNTDLVGGNKVFNVLHNHKTSNQNKDVVKRLSVILKSGTYKEAQSKLKKIGLSSNKRNYNVLKPSGQSPTVMTIPDDYIHYNSPRALTVREMARLQSFDDSFVFQGKRSTGGNNRKTEVPQYTLVGNAVPPLMARAVAMEVLKNIK